jgi:hypothetical protein
MISPAQRALYAFIGKIALNLRKRVSVGRKAGKSRGKSRAGIRD